MNLAGIGIDRLVAAGGHAGLPVDLLAQDVRMASVPGCVIQYMDHDGEQLDVRTRPPRHLTASVNG